MKKLGIILSVLVMFALTGCASSGGGGSSKAAAGGAEPYIVDLSTLTAYLMENNAITVPSGLSTRNLNPFTRKYDNLVIVFPDIPVDLKQYSRVTIRGKYFDADGVELEQADGMAMVSLGYDPRAEIFKDGASNVVLKEFNLGGFSTLVAKDRGTRVNLKENPRFILLQNSDVVVKFIELTLVVFHNGNYSTPE